MYDRRGSAMESISGAIILSVDCEGSNRRRMKFDVGLF